MFHPHPSRALREAFARKPYQGQAPELARFVFVGLDANYAEDVERSPIWPDLLDYLDDGVRFWREWGVHHPFLLPEYRGDGRRYHRTFSRIGFRREHADEVSFVELVHVPTFGRSALEVRDLDRDHLRRLRAAIETGRARHVFAPDRVGKLMRASGEFPWMPKAPTETGGAPSSSSKWSEFPGAGQDSMAFIGNTKDARPRAHPDPRRDRSSSNPRVIRRRPRAETDRANRAILCGASIPVSRAGRSVPRNF